MCQTLSQTSEAEQQRDGAGLDCRSLHAREESLKEYRKQGAGGRGGEEWSSPVTQELRV